MQEIIGTRQNKEMDENYMRIIGITGGVGAGKSQILSYIKSNYKAEIIYADYVANKLKEKGMPCYQPIIDLLGRDILDIEEQIDKGKMAKLIFSDCELLAKANQIIHPAVKEYITNQIDIFKEQAEFDFVFVEAALLIEEGYGMICDELWYIYTEKEQRVKRLQESRGYSLDKIDQIMKQQLLETEFEDACQIKIDNSFELCHSYEQIDKILGGYLCRN